MREGDREADNRGRGGGEKRKRERKIVCSFSEAVLNGMFMSPTCHINIVCASTFMKGIEM